MQYKYISKEEMSTQDKVTQHKYNGPYLHLMSDVSVTGA